MTTSSIAIVGLGWLGWPLAKYLRTVGYRVAGSVTSESKALSLRHESSDISVFVWNANGKEIIPDALFSETMVITLPPGKVEHYTDTVTNLATAAKAHDVQHLIFISSTSVYGGSEVCDETSKLQPETAQAQKIVTAEAAIQSAGIPIWHILRPSGLFGPDRFPARSMSGKSYDAGGRKVNLVHQQDVIEAIHALLNETQSDIFNLSAPSHPSRAEFYLTACQLMDITPPVFTDMSGDGKVIQAEKIEQKTNFRYQVRDLMTWLTQRE